MVAKVGFKMFLGVNVEAAATRSLPSPSRCPTPSPSPAGCGCNLVRVPAAAEREPARRVPRSRGVAAERCRISARRAASRFVELPEECSKLEYSGLLCGVLRGALEMARGASMQTRGVYVAECGGDTPARLGRHAAEATPS